MFRLLFTGLGKLALFVATAAFLTSVSLFLLGAFCLTWPIMRKSPKERRIAATVNLAQAGLTTIQAFAREHETRDTA